MSGSLRIVPSGLPVDPHDHIDLILTSGQMVRFNDPRRFGSVIYVVGIRRRTRCWRSSRPEPFDTAFDADYLWKVSRRRTVSVETVDHEWPAGHRRRQHLRQRSAVPVGIRPRRQGRSLTRDEATRLVKAIRKVLSQAIRVGGTTLRDYVNPEGNPGYFRQKLFVYERSGEPCRNCGAVIRSFTQGQRSTYYCPTCQS